jgi:hypothetical protein
MEENETVPETKSETISAPVDTAATSTLQISIAANASAALSSS